MVVCGHVHQARGYGRIVWDQAADVSGNGELSSETGELPPQGSKKQALIDLTGKKQRRLANDGFREGNSLLGFSMNGFPERQPDSAHTIEPCRNETYIVNASVMANSWPYKGGRKFFSPIIVDLDLPQDISEK